MRIHISQRLKEQVRESLCSVLPITLIVLLMVFFLVPIRPDTLSLFAIGAVMLIVGMGLFTLGVEMSLTPMGEQIGAVLTQRRNLKLMILIAFLMGLFITMAEPDLAVLAEQVPGVPNIVLVLAVAVGVAIFLVLGFLRIVFQKKLSFILIALYGAIFLAGIFINPNYVGVSFDSGGVTTGPITVPFILALGAGVAGVSSGKNGQDDSFGLVAMGSVGPILAVMLLSIFFPGTPSATLAEVAQLADTGQILRAFATAFPHYLQEIAIALAPIIIGFFIFQFALLHLHKKQLIRLCIGLLYTFLGLTLFLTGVNVGFLPAGVDIGQKLGAAPHAWVLVPLGMVMGYFIVAAEPAVHVLNEQVEALTGGAISKRAMLLSLSIGVACSVGLSMIRVLTGLSIWWLLVPGYLLALGLTFVVPPFFTAIAFDSGGVASGAMTSTFLLPLTMGACHAAGGNIMTDAFGVVAMVAMTPLITIQGLGLLFRIKARHRKRMAAQLAKVPETTPDSEVFDIE
ncbi:MAG: DUF1538 domain-containing protein [Oscillospiraceae bacterium]|nr:DUF1538 domain-containing protein [Oscillospiraceae bacterium]